MFGITPEGSRTNRLIKVDKHFKQGREEGSQRDMLSQCFYFSFLISLESFLFFFKRANVLDSLPSV